jgi:hypothetical protein
MAASSFALSGTASRASTRRGGGEGGDEMQRRGAFLRSWLQREVLPSIAARVALSGQLSRTQPEKAAAKRAGSIRFIRMVSQRPPGKPCS